MFKDNKGKITINGKEYTIGRKKGLDNLDELSSAIDEIFEQAFKGDDNTPAGRLYNFNNNIDKMKFNSMMPYLEIIEGAIVDKIVGVRTREGLDGLEKLGVSISIETDRFRVYNHGNVLYYSIKDGAYILSTWHHISSRIEKGVELLKILGVSEVELQEFLKEVKRIERW